jgi:hypothetical protein
MTAVKSLATIALLFAGTSLAVAQNVPATGGQLKTGQPLPKQPWAAPTMPYGYYGSYAYGYGYPAYGYGTGLGYAANTYAPAYSFSYGYGSATPAYGGLRYTYHPVLRRRIYAAVPGVRRYSR